MTRPSSPGEQKPHRGSRRGIRWSWIGAITFLLLVSLAAIGIVVNRAEPTLRSMVIETLSTRFKSKVELDVAVAVKFTGELTLPLLTGAVM